MTSQKASYTLHIEAEIIDIPTQGNQQSKQ